MKKIVVLMMFIAVLAVAFLTPLSMEKAEAKGLVVARIESCPKTCKVGDTIEIGHFTMGLDDSLIAFLRIWAVGEKDSLEQSVLLHTETISSAGRDTFRFTVGPEAGKYLAMDIKFYDSEYQGDVGRSGTKFVEITDGEPLKVFRDMNLGQSGWVEKNGKKYYGNEKGIAVTGKQEIDGKQYFFSGTGVLQIGWFRGDDQKWHYSDEQGIYRAGNMAGVKNLVFPSYIDRFTIDDLCGISKDFYIICEPGSLIEKLAFKYCLQYDNGQKKVIGSNIDNVGEKVKWIVANYITPDMSEEEKIHKLAVWIDVNSSYDYIYGADGVLLYGKGTCQSCAEAFHLLLYEAGVESKVLIGEPDHAWTIVRCNGQWYHTNPVGYEASVPGQVLQSADRTNGIGMNSDERFSSLYSWDPDISVDENRVGWVHTKQGTYYYDGRKENGGRATGLCTIGGTDYLFDDDGKLVGEATEELFQKQKINAFVTRCYKLILNRDADEGGLNSWSEALIKKTAAAAQIIDGFVRSDEFKNRKLSAGESVDVLYKTMLDREADAGGKAGWVDALTKGYTLQNIIDGFCASPEFTAICNSYGIEAGSVNAPSPVDTSTPRGRIEAFVKRCYQLILSREADQGGLQGWSDALEQRTAAAAQIIDGFVRSPEYITRNLSAGESVDILYKTMLDRAADSAGRAGWTDALARGYTLQHIINGFCGSAEFTTICDNYGIVAGSVAVSGAMVKREAIAPEGEEAAPVVIAEFRSEYTDEAKIRAFVEHCYVSVFGREGDAEGIANYTKAILDGKKTPKKVAYEFIFSPEFQNQLPGNEEFIRILYKLYFDRVPGAEELTGWVQMLENGTSLEDIVNGFASSAEFKAIVNSMKE